MSATSKTFCNTVGCYVVAKGSVSGDTTKIYLIWEASQGSESGSHVWSSWINGKACPLKVKIDGSEISLSWTKNKTDSAIDEVKVVKATSSTFTVNKPFFKLSFYNGNQWIEYDFSMYDIENAPTSVSADAITIDGSASSIAEFSNYLGTKSVDGSLKVTWSLGRHSYSKTVKNVYNASYVIPASWLDAISDASQAYAGGSRGRTCSKTCTVNVLPYDIPKFTLIESDRCNKSGEMDNDGTYFLSQSAVEYSSCTGLNSITITAEYKKTDTSEWLNKKTIKPGSNVLGGELDTEFSYDVRYVLKDAFSTVTYIDYVSTAIYLMHFLHGGRGVAFGQKATMDNTLDCAFKALFREDVTIVKKDGTQVSMREVLEKLGF